MASQNRSTKLSAGRRLTNGVAFTGFWLALVALIFAWQVFQYSGFVERLGEWQFGGQSAYFPALTLLALVLLCLLPVLIAYGVFLFLRRRRSRAGTGEFESEHTRLERVTLSANLAMRFLFALGGAALVGALALLVSMLFAAPDYGDAPVGITLGSAAAQNPSQGPARLTGSLDRSRIAVLRDNFALFDRGVLVAPMRPADGVPGPVRYFVEVRRGDEAARPTLSAATGYLKPDALPGELAQLYRNAGIPVAQDNYVLFASKHALLMRRRQAALQLFLFAALCLGFAAWQRRHWRKLREEEGKTLAPAG